MKNLWHEIETGPNPPEIVNVIIENPMGSRKKYEYNKEYNLIEFDRMIFSPFHYPGDYGFIPRTYCEDGDPLDALVLVTEASHPMVLLKVRPIAVLKMIDENKPDNKIISVPLNDPRFNDIKDKKDLSKHLLKEIQHFFRVYKELEGKKVKIGGWGNAKDAKEEIIYCMKLYKKFIRKSTLL
jgi:inorganic pyrophosphatase